MSRMYGVENNKSRSQKLDKIKSQYRPILTIKCTISVEKQREVKQIEQVNLFLCFNLC